MNIIKLKYRWASNLAVRTKTDYIALHHPANKSCTAEDIHRWHLANGWAGIGYHFFVTKEGLIYEGRPLNTIGAQIAGHNSRGIGICVEGNYELEQHLPEAQYKAVQELLDYLKTIYPNAELVGHRDIAASACPGRYFPLNDFKKYWKGELSLTQYQELKQELTALKAQKEKVYHTIDEVPSWGLSTVQKLQDKGFFTGVSPTDIALTETLLRVFVINDRAGLYD
jgi:N-acetyl-anhydromuramyl-L-alanine amidase AmpD